MRKLHCFTENWQKRKKILVKVLLLLKFISTFLRKWCFNIYKTSKEFVPIPPVLAEILSETFHVILHNVIQHVKSHAQGRATITRQDKK